MLSRRASRASRATSIMRSMPSLVRPRTTSIEAPTKSRSPVSVSPDVSALRTSFDDGRSGIVQAANIEEEHGLHHQDIGQGERAVR